MTIKQIVTKLERNPKKLFLIDGSGAMLSAFLLGVVLVQLEKHIGIPHSSLYFLASLPVFFAIYDLYCYRVIKTRLRPYLRLIAMLNLSYCAISIAFAFYHVETMTEWGWAYIIVEVIIVVSLAFIELQIAKRMD